METSVHYTIFVYYIFIIYFDFANDKCYVNNSVGNVFRYQQYQLTSKEKRMSLKISLKVLSVIYEETFTITIGERGIDEKG